MSAIVYKSCQRNNSRVIYSKKAAKETILLNSGLQ